jgi:type IV secretory pathway TrbL component
MRLQLALPVHLALLLLLLLLLVGVVAAVETAGGGAEHAVMTGIVAGDAADDGALDAALGIGGGGRAQHEQRGGDGEKRGFHGSMSPAVSTRQRTRSGPGSRSHEPPYVAARPIAEYPCVFAD